MDELKVLVGRQTSTVSSSSTTSYYRTHNEPSHTLEPYYVERPQQITIRSASFWLGHRTVDKVSNFIVY